jgi:hypothetical protein
MQPTNRQGAKALVRLIAIAFSVTSMAGLAQIGSGYAISLSGMPTSVLYFPIIFKQPTPGGPMALTVVSSNLQGFDVCGYPSLYDLNVWWNKSPYYFMNLYMGGSMMASHCQGLTASYVQSASQIGWWFVPTWVGPQAPCTNYRVKFSSDPTQAYNQGRSEAAAAYQAAASFGLAGDTIIYYDLEGYSYSSTYTTSCRTPVKSFINGWVQKLHELGAKAGVYGGTCSSFLYDFDTIQNKPDDVWAAIWYKINGQYQYDPNASPYGLTCLNDTLWQHRRLRQYTGDHNESWGGDTIYGIDNDVADGEQVAFLPATATPTTGTVQLAPTTQTIEVEDVQPLSSDIAWSVMNGRLLRTEDGGKSWLDKTPSEASSGPVLDSFFLDARQGWLVRYAKDGASLELASTGDAGQTWHKQSIAPALLPPVEEIQDMVLSFADTNTGWLAVKLASGANFSLGSLLSTGDGGKSWKRIDLPAAGRIKFIDKQRGWLSGGPGGHDLYMTADGGQNWTAIQLVDDHQAPAGKVFYSLPSFDNAGNGIIAATVADEINPRIELYTSQDGGLTWSNQGTIRLAGGEAPYGPVQISTAGQGAWVLANPDSPRLYRIELQGFHITSFQPNGLPQGVVSLSFEDSMDGWAQIQSGSCSGSKPSPTISTSAQNGGFVCQLRSGLYKTADGGVSWFEVVP